MTISRPQPRDPDPQPGREPGAEPGAPEEPRPPAQPGGPEEPLTDPSPGGDDPERQPDPGTAPARDTSAREGQT
jgi:hypothetical protein